MARLYIYLLGPFHATLRDKPVVFDYDKVRALLAYLTIESDRPVHREKLAALLWPEASQQAAHNGLRQALSKLRSALSDREEEFPFLLTQRDTIQFNPHADVWVDVWAFSQEFRESAGHRHRRLEICSTCAYLQSQACELYRGDFLEWLSIPDSSVFEEWATIKRERLRRQALGALIRLAGYYERMGDYTHVQAYASRQLELDPLSEEAHCQMICALAAVGQRSQAITHFKAFSRMLEDELGMRPSIETTNLVERIKAGTGESYRENVSGITGLTISGLLMPATPLAGRVVELVELQAWLENLDRRLITIAGPGGIGKTRLAIAVALAQQVTFTHGVVFVNLARFSSAESFLPAVAEGFHLLAEANDLALLEALLVDYLRKKEVLLVLDSFEYVLDSRPALERLLEQAPGLVVLVTSRVHLNLTAEWIFELGGLEIPPVTVEEEIEEYSAVALFLQTARRVRPDFNLASQDHHWVREICCLVQGMPLAIILAAHWVRLLSCQEIAHEIHTSLDFLAASTKGASERHTSVRAVFDQSWRMLEEEDQRVFRRLSVFRGGFDRHAAQEVAGARLEILAKLVDQSFLVNVFEGRYDCHDLLRQYALEKLVDAGELEQVVQSHFHYFLRLAEVKESQLESIDKLQAFNWFIREQPNLLAALQSALSDGPTGDAHIAHRLEALLHENWHHYGVHHAFAGINPLNKML
jgi:predicted ATPase/DNA-binding SARP family transcriptional activator